MIRDQEQMLLQGETQKKKLSFSSLGKEGLDGRWWVEGILLICKAVLLGGRL